MVDHIYKYPRLYLNASLQENAHAALNEAQAHYLRNVLRKSAGAQIRVFNGADGEFLAQIEDVGKKCGTIVCEKLLRAQPQTPNILALYFAPIKKQRMEILIEKAVELGVTDLYPVITNRTESRDIKAERVMAQMIEAAEQCERMDVPRLHDVVKLPVLLARAQNVKLYAALERTEAHPLKNCDFTKDAGFLIGPEGGFDAQEIEMIAKAGVQTVSLGAEILRAETAALACLSYAKLSTV